MAAPIIPGLKILTRKNQLTNIPRNFFAEIPADLSDEVAAASDKHVRDVGVEWALRQSQELLDRGVPSLHFYVMQDSTAIRMLMDKLRR
jgi:methylenetetrahydrofolate reductase (NADPH)